MPQVDLSSDCEASVDLQLELCLSSDRLAIERVIAKVFAKYQCDVIVTDRLRSLFTSKLYRMGKAIQSAGGTGRARLIKKWKETTWTIDLKGNEMIPYLRKPDHVIVDLTNKNKLN